MYSEYIYIYICTYIIELKKLKEYMWRQWINNSVFTLSSISVYGLSVRTNNDTEGYNSRLRIKAMKGFI